MQLNTYAATQEDEKKHKTAILITNNAERKQRTEEALKSDLSTQEEQWKRRLAERKRNSSINRTQLSNGGLLAAPKLVGGGVTSAEQGAVPRLIHALDEESEVEARLKGRVRYVLEK